MNRSKCDDCPRVRALVRCRNMLDRAEAELLEVAARGDTALVAQPTARMKTAAN